MRRALKILKRLSFVLLIIAILAGASGYLYLRRSLPQLSGAVRLPGLSAQVEVIRDRDGIPHIYAQNKHDGLAALGYVHAQDRLWQMEFQRRLGQGRLSELLGSVTLSTDRYMRIVGPYRAATSAWTTLPEESKRSVQAYIDGINSYLTVHTGSKRPLEASLLGATIEPWTGPDVLVWVKMMAWNLSSSYTDELLYSEVGQAVGPERAAQLLPAYPQEGITILTAPPDSAEPQAVEKAPPASSAAQPQVASHLGGMELIALDDQVRALLAVVDSSKKGLGSNNWVVDGTKSITGKPLLANDPHLGVSLPSIWYLAHLSVGDFDVIGATIPGLPGVVVGHNQFIAWGVTDVNPDVQDLYRERLDQQGLHVELEGRWEPLAIITETIKVKDQPDVQQRVRLTPHGPLISDAINADNLELPAQEQGPSLEPLALRWTALDPTDTTIQAFLEINQARNWEQFTAALEAYVAPAQNFIYADTSGNIGYYLPGRIPLRTSGDGSLPAEGWSGTAEWQAWIPFEQLPHVYNPPEHFIVTANNRPVPTGYAYHLGRNWESSYRAQRITDLLLAKQQHTVADFAGIQGDTVSLFAQQLLPKLLALVTPRDQREQEALALLRSWDYDVRGDSKAAAIFEAWFQQLPQLLAGDELGPRLSGEYNGLFAFTNVFLLETLEDQANPWCDNVLTTEPEDCRAIAQQALLQALDKITALLGPESNSWRWDQLHTLQISHQVFDQVPVLQGVFSRTLPHGGDWSTVDIGTFGFRQVFYQRVAAGYRQIIDLAELEQSQFILLGGQSGHILSPHYADYLEDWAALRYRPMRFARETVQASQEMLLVLQP